MPFYLLIIDLLLNFIWESYCIRYTYTIIIS